MEERLLKSSFGLSLFIHMALFALAATIWSNPALREQLNRKTVWIELPKPKTRASEEERVVRSRQGYKSDEAAPDAFLGAETRRVQEQTASKDVSNEMAGKPVAQPQAKTEKKSDAGKRANIARLGVPILNVGREQTPDQPQWSDYSDSYGSVSQDYVEGLKKTETSALNTREFVFFSYFERIRKRLDLAWTPILREELIKMFRSGRQLASDRDHVTRTVVTLDGKGHIVKVDVIEESGVTPLDKAAVNAFNRAGPFPNPPTGLVSKDGTVQIRWDFVLKT